MQERFNDQNKRITEFQTEVLVVCPSCGQKAMASVDYGKERARLLCTQCSYNKENTTESTVLGIKGHWQMAAHQYFNAKLWLQQPFKNEVFWAYNEQHLAYLESYIGATLREHKDRSHFTLLEKLPKFYHEAKNRAALLKLIDKLKQLSAKS
ncbi:zinc ribbon domain-containing protein [Pedobacter sp.]|uniref:zinc ribbon domain-containing protein n=1 Tax=Pedobacter sp. TaxID=1411316 RepID=UPI0031DA862E